MTELSTTATKAITANTHNSYKNAELNVTPAIMDRRAKDMGQRALFDGFMVMESVRSPYEDMRDEIRSRVVEQDEAIDTIIEALERSAVRLPSDQRPIANLAFLGPTGVGKTEVAKTLSELIDEEFGSMIRVDCANFSNGHEVSTLLGSPPSFVGREQVPMFTKDRVETGKTIILFDELEKGSPELYNIMLKIMDEGELTLNNGEEVSFRDTVIIMTSNLGAKQMADSLSTTSLGFGGKKLAASKPRLDKVAKEAFTEFFKPEFVNRITKTVVFHPLTGEGLGRVLDVKLNMLNVEYENEYGALLSVTPGARQHLVDIAQREAHFGARPLIRALENDVQTMFGRYTSAGQVPEGTHVRVYHRDELPEEFHPQDDSPLVFTQKRDESLRKYRPPKALAATAAHPALFKSEEAEVRQEEL